jgi:hypothetical protein
MRKIALFTVALLMTVAAHAQFEKGKGYLGASFSGFDISSQSKQFHLGLNAKAGYLFQDNLMAIGEVGYEHWKDFGDNLVLGAAARYYISQNGIYLGAGLKYRHSEGYNDLMPGVHAGYAFFITRTVTLEPEIFFDISTKSSDYMSYGLRLGVGIYLFKDQYKLKR